MMLMVTGGAGFIGSAFVRQALSLGHSVVNIDALTYAGNLDNLASVEDHPHYSFEHLDINDRPAVDRLFSAHSPCRVVHFAAESHVDSSITAPDAFIQTNIIGTFSMLEAARAYWSQSDRENFRFHHVSTDEVFGSLDLDEDRLFDEQAPYDPRSPYSASKAASDHLVRAWHETYGLPVTLSNCSNNYGPFHHPEKLIPVVILSCLQNKPIPLYGDGKNVRDWLFVEDHADAILKIIEKGEIGRTYNIGGEAELSNLDLVTRICDIFDRLRPRESGSHAELITPVKDRPGHDRRYAINISRIGKELGWRPSVFVDQGLEKTVRWYMDNQDWWRSVLEGQKARQTDRAPA